MKEIDLDKLSKKEYYAIPEGYFDQLPKQVMQNIKKQNMRTRTICISAVAAVMLLVLCTTLVVRLNIRNSINSKPIVTTKEPVKETIDNQMAEYYSAELAQMDYYDF